MLDLDAESVAIELVALVGIVAVALLLSAPWWIGVLVALLAVPPTLLVSRRIRRSLRRRARIGAEALPGENGVITARLSDPNSLVPYVVRLGGELWTARSPEQLAIGDRVLVLEVEDNHLLVCRLPREIAER